MSNETEVVIVPQSNSQHITGAAQELRAEADGTAYGLRTRFPPLNRYVLKHFRFSNIFTFAGASGAGKSFLLNMLRTDFTDQIPLELEVDKFHSKIVDFTLQHGEFVLKGDKLVRSPIQAEINFNPLILDFSLEMNGRVQNIRTLCTLTGFGFDYLLSSRKVGVDAKGNDVFNKLSEPELEFFEAILKEFANRRNLLTVSKAVTLDQFEQTIRATKMRFPNRPLVVLLDHTLLIEAKQGQSDTSLQNDLIRRQVDLKDELGAMFINLAQFNSEIERFERRTNSGMHYPTKKDIYCGGQLYQGSDYVFTLFAPASIGIEEYGPRKIPTKDLIHLSGIKSRHGSMGQMWFRNELGHGKLTPLRRNPDTGAMMPTKTLINNQL